MTKRALDPRLSQPGAYITYGLRLLRVEHVRTMGAGRTEKKQIDAEDTYTEKIVTLTEDELAQCKFVCHSGPDSVTGPAAA